MREHNPSLAASLRGANGSRECAPDDRLRDEAIQAYFAWRDGLLRFARNDEGIAKLYKGRHTPRMRGIQYAATFRFHHCCLWNTGSSAGACHRAAIRPTRWRTMTTEYDSAFSLLKKPELCMNFSLQKRRGSRECRVRAAPAVSCAKCKKEAHTSIQVQSEQSGIPCAMALRLIPCSPRRANSSCHRRCRLDGSSIRLDRCRHRQLGTSNGCRDHTVLPYATSAVRPRVGSSLTSQSLPCDCHFAPDAAASTASLPTSVTIMIRPSGGRDGERCRGVSTWPRSEIFFDRGLDSFLLICPSGCLNTSQLADGFISGRARGV